MKKSMVKMAGIAVLGGALLCSTAYAAPANTGTFSAMKGVAAQTMSVEEMQAVSGQLSAADIAAALAKAADAAKNAKVSSALTQAAAAVSSHASAIDAFLAKLKK